MTAPPAPVERRRDDRRPVLGLRADGGEGIGAGHLARCLALAQAWIDGGGEVVLATAAVPDEWRRRYEAEGVAVVDIGSAGAVAPASAEIEGGAGAGPEAVAAVDVWVVDGYRIGPLPGVARYLRIDDRGISGDDAATLVLDQNLGADPADYPQPADRVLAGPRFALLRRDLVAAAAAREARGDDRDPGPPRVLVAAGGAPAPAVRRLVDAVVAELADADLGLVVWGGADDPVPALARADVALAAAGSTLWELCRFGIPAVVVAVADNQVPLAAAAVASGVAIDAGRVTGGAADPAPDVVAALVRSLAVDDGRRQAMAATGRALVDGGGAARVAERIRAELLPEP